MLIIPLSGKISRRNPPFITIAIILINCFVFFILQARDNQRYFEAGEFYLESGLAQIEISRYIDYLKYTQKTEDAPGFENKEELNETTLVKLSQKMHTDSVFMQKLLNNGVITHEEEIYPQWKDLRSEYEGLLSKIVFIRYGFTPAKRNFLNAFTYMFIHGSFMHLFGNMVFLWLVGCVLELGCGRLLYVLMYVLTGMLSVGLFHLAYMDSVIPLVGASGAISGLMGAYTVTYGKRKIKVFYSLGFYFNYAQIVAIVILPIWIAKECLQLFFGGTSHVAYVAHIGGLISGALVGFLNLKFLGRVDKEVFDQDPREGIPALLEEALRRIGKIDMNGARPFLEQVLQIDPHNREALTHLFNIDKLHPQDEQFHKTASRLLHHLINDPGNRDALYSAYREYCSISKHPRLNLNLLFSIAATFSAQGHLPEAEKIVAALMRTRPNLERIPAGILNLARGYLKKGMSEKGKQRLRIICQKYPESTECQVARRLLKESSR
jgi:membrane associated rhomboid family serine protease